MAATVVIFGSPSLTAMGLLPQYLHKSAGFSCCKSDPLKLSDGQFVQSSNSAD